MTAASSRAGGEPTTAGRPGGRRAEQVCDWRGQADWDVLVVGSGIAGLSMAVALGGRRRVAIVAKESGGGGSTVLAQGGIAAPVAAGDSASAHVADTIAAAAGLGDVEVTEAVIAGATEAVATLAQLGVRFDGGALAKEGGHSFARVVHARGDATGAEITRALMETVRERAIPLMTGTFLVDLLTEEDGARVTGALVWDCATRSLRPVRASTVVLATGGYGQLWARTTSPWACSGDGLAAALRAGAQVADLEFVQFHPTGMDLGRDPRPLASEALRGAGARLRDSGGDYLHASLAGDLAPRDVVSKSMARRMQELGADYCFLDATPIGGEALEARFPTFVAACRAAGVAPEREWVRVSPTAHYTMGGVLTDADGRTTLEGLMAVGEVAASGLHGANRLASNSLLEGAVIGRRAAHTLLSWRGPVPPRPTVAVEPATPPPGTSRTDDQRAGSTPFSRAELRAAMQAVAGVSRTATGLAALARDLAGTRLALASPDGGPQAWELANMAQVARAVVALADRRHESRGAHWRADYPEPRSEWLVRQVAQLGAGDDFMVGNLPIAGGLDEHGVDGAGAGETGVVGARRMATGTGRHAAATEVVAV